MITQSYYSKKETEEYLSTAITELGSWYITSRYSFQLICKHRCLKTKITAIIFHPIN